MKRRTSISFFLAPLLALALACGGGEKKPGGSSGAGGDSLAIAFDNAPTNLDPRVGNDSASGRLGDLVMSGLIKPSKTVGDYDPDLAEKWEFPDDKTIVFHLRPNLKFHNGKPLSSADVKFTYESLLAPDFTSPKKSGYDVLDKIETPDAQTVIFRLKSPNGGMLDNLTLGIVPQGADANAFKSQPIGAGPYRVVESDLEEKVELEAYDGFHAGAPAIKRVTARVIPDATTRVLEMRRGTVDFQVNSIPPDAVAQFEKDPAWKVVKVPGTAYQYISFNLKDPILRKKQVRQAIAHAIDRERLVRDLLKGYGKVTESMFPEGHWARSANLPTYNYDVAKAKSLLDAAGHRDPDGDGPKMRFNLKYKTSTDVEANQQAEIIQQMLKLVGVGVEIQSNEFATFYDDIQNGRFQLFSLRRTGIADPDFYYIIFHSKSLPPEGQNRGYFINPEVDAAIMTGRTTFDRAKRQEAYTKIQQIAAEELPYVSLYIRDTIATMKKNVDVPVYPNGFMLGVPLGTMK